MKKITLFALILVAFMAVLWSCTKDEVSIEKQNAQTNELVADGANLASKNGRTEDKLPESKLSPDELAQQLAKDEDFVKLQNIEKDYADVHLLTFMSLKKADRQLLVTDLNNKKITSPVVLRFFKEIKWEETNRLIVDLLSNVMKRHADYKNLSKADRKIVFSRASLILKQKRDSKTRIEARDDECQANLDACIVEVMENFVELLGECEGVEPQSDKEICEQEAHMIRAMGEVGCYNAYATCKND